MTASVPERRGVRWLASIPFFGVHIAAIVGVAMLGFSWTGLLLALGMFVIRMFGVTGGYHRYFSHRTYRTSRVFQFFLALLAMSSVQKGVLWWAAHHRTHHKLSDLPGDVHSPVRDGFWWSHVGWIVSGKHDDTDMSKVKDLAKYPELVWLNRWHLVPSVGLAVIVFAIGGWWALVWGYFVSTTILWHATFTINSLSHVFGKRRFATTDDSRNNVWLAILTLGEGWHNNHHHYQGSVRQGFYWWEIDVTYYVLWMMSKVGLVWDLHGVPARVLTEKRIDVSEPKSADAPVVAKLADAA